MDRNAARAAKEAHLLPCIYPFYREPVLLVRGEMEYLFDDEGRRYLDAFSGVAVTSAGHANPLLVEALARQAATLQHTTTIYLTRPILELAERVARLVPGEGRRCFFVNSGSEANDGALLLARLHRQAPHLLSLHNSLHGRTHLTMSVTGLPLWRTDPHPYPEVSFLPAPYCLRCGLGLRFPACDLACAQAADERIREVGPSRVAALILEPVQGNGGIIVPPPGYLARVREILDRHGVLLVADEVQTGFGRTGRDFALQHSGVEADIVTMAKALGNGMAIGALAAAGPVADSYRRPGASTTGGSPLAASTALAVLDYHQEHALARRAARLGEALLARLREGLEGQPGVAEIRGVGLYLGVELTGEDLEPDAPRLETVLERLKEEGILAGKTGEGRNVLTLIPPLVIGEEALEELGDRVVQAVAEA